MRQHPAALVIHGLAVDQIQQGSKLATSIVNCHWKYFPRSDLCLPLSPTHPPAQPSCPAMFCPLLSRVNRAEIAQLPRLPTPQNALDVTACWGGKIAPLRLLGLFGLDRAGVGTDHRGCIGSLRQTGLSSAEQSRVNEPKLCRHT